jgi:hypothetical protein
MGIKPPFSGAVKEYSVESYGCSENGDLLFDGKCTWKYNGDHQISEVRQYDAGNELLSVSSYTYDNDHNLREIITKTADGTTQQTLVHEYKNNKLVRITDNAADYQIVTVYDDYGNPIEKQNIGEDGSPFSVTRYINLYDQSNRLTEKHTVFPSLAADWIDKYMYNEKGLLIEEQRTKHRLTSITRHSYNDRGDLILSDFNPDESNNETLKKDIVYNENNDIVEVREYRKGWCYQDRNGEFSFIGIARYSYTR